MSDQTTDLNVSPEAWDNTPDEVKTIVLSLLQRVAALEEQIKLNSQNSNKPPSSGKSRKKKGLRRSKKKRGGQPGHKGNTRTLLPPEEIDQFILCKPDKCTHCDHPLGTPKRVGRHQVLELPVIRPVVTDYQIWTCRCQKCGNTSKGKIPPDVGDSTYGPRIIAMSGLMSGYYHLSKRQIHRIMGEFFNVPMSLGSVSNNEKLISRSFEGIYKGLLEELPNQEVLNIDETRFDEKGEKGWLWTFVGKGFTVFKHRENRRRTLLENMIGPDFRGIIGSDRYRAYEYFAGERRQICWAHLLRDFERFRIRGGESERIGDLLAGQAEKMFELWHRVRDGTLKRAIFEQKTKLTHHKAKHFRTLGASFGHPKTAETCGELLKHYGSLWTFVNMEGIQPTNNAAERALRSAVIYRKRCFGIDSRRGARFVERLLSVVESTKQQGKNVLEFLENAVVRLFSNEPAPPLLPT